MNKEDKINIRNLDVKSIEAFLIEHNEAPYRAKQIYEWIWKKNTISFENMTNIPKNLQAHLSKHFYANSISINQIQISKDKTIKVSFRLHDGNLIEGVLIPDKSRVTACISTQVGCALNCKFCATAKLGFRRNLYFEEIFDQIVQLNQLSIDNLKNHLSNIVVMGMGEPLMNYENLMKAIKFITNPDILGISPTRITVSTSGIADKIKQLADDNIKFELAISLNSSNNIKRSTLMPVNQKYSLPKLTEAIKYFYDKTAKRITYEYIIFKDINDSLTDAKELAEFCKISPCKINIIEYNTTLGTGLKKADTSKLKAFADYLKTKNLIVNIRRSHGKDIDAACGQLANKIKSEINHT